MYVGPKPQEHFRSCRRVKSKSLKPFRFFGYVVAGDQLILWMAVNLDCCQARPEMYSTVHEDVEDPGAAASSRIRGTGIIERGVV
jgi:hypothetical protein